MKEGSEGEGREKSEEEAIDRRRERGQMEEGIGKMRNKEGKIEQR